METPVLDNGPIYFETLQWTEGKLIEPWNAFSSLVYLIPVVFFLIHLRGQYRKQGFIVFFALPLLAAGGTGSTLYHAFRSAPALMYLDVFPIVLLTLAVSYWFMYKVMRNYWLPALIIVVTFLIRGITFRGLELQTAINISYFITGLLIFLPAFFYARKGKFQKTGLLLISAALFSASLFFRFWDDNPEQIMHQGTHWLWHVFSAAGAWMLGMYLVKTNTGEGK